MKWIACVCGALLMSEGLAAQTAGRVKSYQVPSRALAQNLLGAPGVGDIEVYLPRSYNRERTRRYPVLYLLHGIQGTSADWTKPGYGMTIQGLMDSLSAAGRIREFIVVIPTANNAYAGSYYSNSPVIGNWEDYLSHDLVAWVDSAFRTIPTAASRGIAGHSMGGFGAIIMAMRHADVFGVAYAMSPCCLAAIEDISNKNEAWGRMAQFRDLASLQAAASKGDIYPIAIVGLSAVMSPDPARAPLYVDLPYEKCGDSVCAVRPVLDRWLAQLPVAQVPQGRDGLVRLRTPLRLEYGYDDQFLHIPPAVQMFVDSLTAHRVPYRLDVFDGDHRNRMRARMIAIVLPFFSEFLADAPRSPR